MDKKRLFSAILIVVYFTIFFENPLMLKWEYAQLVIEEINAEEVETGSSRVEVYRRYDLSKIKTAPFVDYGQFDYIKEGLYAEETTR